MPRNRSAFTPALPEVGSSLKECDSLRMFSTESFRNMTRFPIITWHTSSCNWVAEKMGLAGCSGSLEALLGGEPPGRSREPAGKLPPCPHRPSPQGRDPAGSPRNPKGSQIRAAAPGRGSCREGPADAEKQGEVNGFTHQHPGWRASVTQDREQILSARGPDRPWSAGRELTLPRRAVLPARTPPLHPWERSGHAGSLPGVHWSGDRSWGAPFPAPASTGSATECTLALVCLPPCSSASGCSLLGRRLWMQAELPRLCPTALLADPTRTRHGGHAARASRGNR